MKKYLFLFGQKKPGENLYKFATAELRSIAQTLKIQITEIDDTNSSLIRHPFQKSSCTVISVESKNDVNALLSRSILTKVAIELWGGGSNYDELNKSIKEEMLKDEGRSNFVQKNFSFCMRVKGVGKKVQMPDQRRKIELITEVPLEGPVNLSAPDEEFYIIEDYLGADGNEPAFVYFGHFIGEGQRRLLDTYALTKRKFIGNTSMDPEMSFLMSNLAKVDCRSLAFDPFVGSGSILVSAAHFGAHIIGGDINYNVVHAKGKSSRHTAKFRSEDESILANMRQYNLEHKYVDVLISDAAQHAWNLKRPMFDAIITDPPYGIREGSRKIGLKKKLVADLSALSVDTPHYPEQKEYKLDQVFKDLLEFAAATLVKNGRLVYFLPVTRSEYTDEFVPTHPQMKLCENLEQVLNTHSSRRLIVMEKVAEFDSSLQADIASDFYCKSNSFRKKYFNYN